MLLWPFSVNVTGYYSYDHPAKKQFHCSSKLPLKIFVIPKFTLLESKIWTLDRFKSVKFSVKTIVVSKILFKILILVFEN